MNLKTIDKTNLEIKRFLERHQLEITPLVPQDNNGKTALVPKDRIKNNPDAWTTQYHDVLLNYDAYGIKTGNQRQKENTFLLVIDIDGDNHNTSGFNRWNNFLSLSLMDKETKKQLEDNNYTFTVRSASGKGIHLYFYIPTTDIVSALNSSTKFNSGNGIDIIHGENNTITGPSSAKGNGKYEVICDKDIQVLPEELYQLVFTDNSVTERDVVIDWEETTEQEELLTKLKTAAEQGVFDERNDWLAVGMALQNEGFTIGDWKSLSWTSGDPTDADLERYWNTFRDNNYSMGTLQFYAKTVEEETNESVIKNYYLKTVLDKDGNEKKKLEYYYHFPKDIINLSDHFYNLDLGEGKGTLIERLEPTSSFTGFNETRAYLDGIGYGFDIKSKGSITKAEIFHKIKKEADKIKRLSALPEIDSDPDTLYTNKHVEPSNTGKFRELMDIFTTDTIKDNYRLAAAFLSGFLSKKFDGKKPLFSILAPIQSSGKTTVVVEGCKIIQGVEPVNFEGEKEDEENMGGIPQIANKFVLYDNLDNLKNSRKTRITKSITDPRIKSWLMNVSHGTVPNNKTYFATINKNVAINDDMLARMVSINMKDGRDISPNEKASISEKLNCISENRDKVVADIMFAIRQLEPLSNYTNIKVNAPEKASLWAQEIARLLSHFYPEIKEFDFSLTDDDKNLSNEAGLWIDYFQWIKDNHEELLDGTENFLPSMKLYDYFERYCEEIGIEPEDVGVKNKAIFGRYFDSMSKSITDFTFHKTRKRIAGGNPVRGYEIKYIGE